MWCFVGEVKHRTFYKNLSTSALRGLLVIVYHALPRHLWILNQPSDDVNFRYLVDSVLVVPPPLHAVTGADTASSFTSTPFSLLHRSRTPSQAPTQPRHPLRRPSRCSTAAARRHRRRHSLPGTTGSLYQLNYRDNRLSTTYVTPISMPIIANRF